MIPSSHTQFKDKDINKAYELLFSICDLLTDNGIVYHLEGGTLLGFIRDKKLLPWDHDLDISIPSSELPKLINALDSIDNQWRISKRIFAHDSNMWKKNDLRLIKIKNRFLYFMPGDQCLDIFIKYTYKNESYWQAADFIMKADAKHYESYESIQHQGHELQIPLLHEQYLKAKYGDWKTPNKNWVISQEQTISDSIKE